MTSTPTHPDIYTGVSPALVEMMAAQLVALTAENESLRSEVARLQSYQISPTQQAENDRREAAIDRRLYRALYT